MALAATQGSGVRLAKLETTLPDRLVADDDAALSQGIFDIPKTEARAVIQPHGMGDDLARITIGSVGISGALHPQIMPRHPDSSST